MILFEQAFALVAEAARILPSETVSFTHCKGRILAEDVFSDIDMPPFDKSAMDGFACRREDLPGPFLILETIPAGQSPTLSVGQGQCSRIMTGSQLPEEANCVIKVEETSQAEDGSIHFTGQTTNDNICFKAEDVRKGQLVIKKGELLSASHIAVLASVGHSTVQVSRAVKVGILSTGDELVEPQQIPGPAQIRNSNAYQMIAQAESCACAIQYYGIAPDEESGLLSMIRIAMAENDLILLSGGVSMGDYDLVPPMLEKAGFSILFNKIAVMPGSPTLFAVTDSCYCFGLPGNPVSSFVQFELLVKPLIYKLMGHELKTIVSRLPMGAPFFRKKANRLSFVPVTFNHKGEILPLEYHGSAHIHAYVEASGIMSVPIDTYELKAGEPADVRFL